MSAELLAPPLPEKEKEPENEIEIEKDKEPEVASHSLPLIPIEKDQVMQAESMDPHPPPPSEPPVDEQQEQPLAPPTDTIPTPAANPPTPPISTPTTNVVETASTSATGIETPLPFPPCILPTYPSLQEFASDVTEFNRKEFGKRVLHDRFSCGKTNRIMVCETSYRHKERWHKQHPKAERVEKKISYQRPPEVCPFRVSCQSSKGGRKVRNSGIVFKTSKNGCWTHHPECGSVYKASSKELVNNNAFEKQIKTSGGRITGKMLRDAASSAGFADTTISMGTIYYAKGKIKESERAMSNSLWTGLPKYLRKVCVDNPGSYFHVDVDEVTKEFKGAFIALAPACEALRTCGKQVHAADMGLCEQFQGVCAMGTGQFGSGRSQEMWAAVYASKDHVEGWNYIIKQLKLAKMDDMYDKDWATITDETHCEVFEEAFPLGVQLADATRLLETTYAQAPKNEKKFPSELFWQLRHAHTKDEFTEHLAQLHKSYPTTAENLAKLRRKRWALYAILAKENCGSWDLLMKPGDEISPKASKTPLAQACEMAVPKFFHHFVRVSRSHLEAERKSMTQWKMEKKILVPKAKTHWEKMNVLVQESAAVVEEVGPMLYSCDYRPSRPDSPPVFVDMSKAECACKRWQDLKMPCQDAVAVFNSIPNADERDFWAKSFNHCYFVSDTLEKNVMTVSAPILETSSAKETIKAKIPSQVIALSALGESDDEDKTQSQPQTQTQTHDPPAPPAPVEPDVVEFLPPKDATPNGKAERKKRKSSAMVPGEPGEEEVVFKQRRQRCRLCKESGRDDESAYGHKAPSCPHAGPAFVDMMTPIMDMEAPQTHEISNESAQVVLAQVETAQVQPAHVGTSEVEMADVQPVDVQPPDVVTADIRQSDVQTDVQSADVQPAEVVTAEVEIEPLETMKPL